jgi:Zn-dependent M28 family amino/carboxypeptidase
VSPGLATEPIARANVVALGLDARYEIVWNVPPTPGSDHWPYYSAGVPVFYGLWDPIPNYHRSGDTAAACTRDDKYEAAVALAHAMIDDLGRIPVGRRT